MFFLRAVDFLSVCGIVAWVCGATKQLTDRSSVRDLKVNVTRQGGKKRISLDNYEVFSDTHFTTVLFDDAVDLRGVAEQLPRILSGLEQKNHFRLETMMQIVAAYDSRGTLVLLRHTAPQKDDGPLM